MPASSSPRRVRRLAAALGVAVLGVTAGLTAPIAIDRWLGEDGPAPIASRPANRAETGMVYDGLTPAKKGDPCVGAYQVTEREQCSHGPDEPPPGLSVQGDIAPVAAAIPAGTVPPVDTAKLPTETDVVADEGGFTTEGGVAMVPDAAPGAAAFTMGPNGVACDGDGVSGKRVQVLYVRAAGTASRFNQFLESFRTWAAGVDTIYSASAKETGGERHVRFVTTPDCKVDVREVEVPAGAMDTFSANISALKSLGHNRTDRKYMIFGESKVYCGIGTFAGDTQPGANNRSNGGPGYGRSDSGCWSPGVAAHELGHNLGAVNNNAPNSSKAAHCLDEYDVMCYNDSGGLKTSVRTNCANRSQDQRLDCNHDDYYHTNPSAGSYLATNWNMANSQFLIAGGADPNPDPTPTPSKTTAAPTPSKTTSSPTPGPSKTTSSPSPSRTTTSPSPTGTTTPPPGLKELRTSDVTANSVRLAWDAAAAGTRYTVVLDGKALGQVSSTRVRIVGLRPDREYSIGVTVNNTPYTKTATVKTLAAPVPPAGSFSVFSNSLTGGVADVFGARSAPGTPIIIYRKHGGANQLWKVEPAAGNRFLVRSKATSQCVTTVGNKDVAGATLVQQDCATAMTWTMAKTEFGVALTSPGGLVLGVSNNQFLGSRLLVLQRPTGAKYQSWVAQQA